MNSSCGININRCINYKLIQEDFSCHKNEFSLAFMVTMSLSIQVTNWYLAEMQTKYFVFNISRWSNWKCAATDGTRLKQFIKNSNKKWITNRPQCSLISLIRRYVVFVAWQLKLICTDSKKVSYRTHSKVMELNDKQINNYLFFNYEIISTRFHVSITMSIEPNRKILLQFQVWRIEVLEWVRKIRWFSI